MKDDGLIHYNLHYEAFKHLSEEEQALFNYYFAKFGNDLYDLTKQIGANIEFNGKDVETLSILPDAQELKKNFLTSLSQEKSTQKQKTKKMDAFLLVLSKY